MQRADRETQLLLLCASPPTVANRSERIAALAGESLDWERLLAAANAHSVAPMLYWELKGCRADVIPASLSEAFQYNVRNCMWMTDELVKVLDLLRRNGIVAIPFKGPTLAISGYGNLTLRQFADLDLLVLPEEALRARTVLLDGGFTTDLKLTPVQEAPYLRVYDEFVFLGAGGAPMVELHWAVTSRYFSIPLDVRPFWKRSVSVPVGGRTIAALHPDDLLLVLCIHGTKHCWSHISLISDVAWLVARNEIGWERVLEEARRIGALRMVLLGIELAKRLLELPIPSHAEARAEDTAVQSLVARVEAQLLGGRDIGGGILRAASFHMQARERWADRYRYLFRLGTTTGIEDWQSSTLPAP